MRKFVVNDEIFEMFPELSIGVVIVTDLNNTNNQEFIEYMLRESEQHVMKKFEGVALSEIEPIGTWRRAYKSFGAKKSKRSSIESLLKRSTKGNELPFINPLVDLYNAVSLRYQIPCGGEDLGALQGDLRLMRAIGNEYFVSLGANENDPPVSGEIIYHDAVDTVCRCWNWREADRTKLTENTQSAILVFEILKKEQEQDLYSAMNDLSKVVDEVLGGRCINAVVNQKNRLFEF